MNGIDPNRLTSAHPPVAASPGTQVAATGAHPSIESSPPPLSELPSRETSPHTLLSSASMPNLTTSTLQNVGALSDSGSVDVDMSAIASLLATAYENIRASSEIESRAAFKQQVTSLYDSAHEQRESATQQRDAAIVNASFGMAGSVAEMAGAAAGASAGAKAGALEAQAADPVNDIEENARLTAKTSGSGPAQSTDTVKALDATSKMLMLWSGAAATMVGGIGNLASAQLTYQAGADSAESKEDDAAAQASAELKKEQDDLANEMTDKLSALTQTLSTLFQTQHETAGKIASM